MVGPAPETDHAQSVRIRITFGKPAPRSPDHAAATRRDQFVPELLTVSTVSRDGARGGLVGFNPDELAVVLPLMTEFMRKKHYELLFDSQACKIEISLSVRTTGSTESILINQANPAPVIVICKGCRTADNDLSRWIPRSMVSVLAIANLEPHATGDPCRFHELVNLADQRVGEVGGVVKLHCSAFECLRSSWPNTAVVSLLKPQRGQ